MTRSERIEACARRLMDILNKNVGEKTADWPIHIQADDDIAHDLCASLQALQDSLLTMNDEPTKEELEAVDKVLSKVTKKEQAAKQKLDADILQSSQQILFSLDAHIRAFLEKIEGKLPDEKEYEANSYILTIRSTDPSALTTQYLIWKNERVLLSRVLVDKTGISVKSGELPSEFWPPMLKDFIAHRRAES